MLLIANLTIDISDLREMRDSGQITEAEYEQRKKELRHQFKVDEQRQFEEQLLQ